MYLSWFLKIFGPENVYLDMSQSELEADILKHVYPSGHFDKNSDQKLRTCNSLFGNPWSRICMFR